MRVLVFSNDHVGTAMAGPGIRSYNFACELAKDFEVTLMVPRPTDLEIPAVEVVDVEGVEPDELAARVARFDAVVSQFLPLQVMRRLHARRTRVIYDLYIPFVERLGFLDADLGAVADADALPPRAEHLFAEGSRLVQRFALATGTAFVCASERQADLWLGMLAGLGRIDLERYRRDPTLRNLVDVVPFGLPEEPPSSERPLLKGVYRGIGPDDRVLLWAGGVWNWLDPLTPIRAVARISRRRDDVKLLFLGLKRPVPAGQTAMAARAVELARELGLLDRSVFFNFGWVPYEDRQSYLLEADLGVSAHFASLETHFAFRTRLLDYFWTGIPVVTTGGDVLGELVRTRGLGRAVEPEDVDAWERAIDELLADEGLRDRLRPAFDAVRAEYTWPVVTEPLVRLLREPDRARDGSWNVRAMTLEDMALRARVSLALGGPGSLARRQAAKLARIVRRP
ncbi:MAG: glycosyltransferase family 4 protein [Actinomycetota bacterium]